MSWTTVFLAGRELMDGNNAALIAPVVVLAAVFAGLTWLVDRRGLKPGSAEGVIWSGMGAVGGWFLLMISAFGVVFMLLMSAPGGVPGSGPRLVTPLNVGLAFVPLFVAGCSISWRCSNALALHLGAPPAPFITATIASCVAACLWLRPLALEIKQRHEAFQETQAAEQARLAALRRPGELERGCVKGLEAECYWLAGTLRSGKQVPKDLQRALAIYQRGCDLGNPHYCSEAGIVYSTDPEAPIDLPRAAALLDRAGVLSKTIQARAGLPENAEYLERAAMLYLDGRAKNVPRAIELLTRTCELEAPASCARLGVLYLEGTEVPQDLAKARRSLHKACDGGVHDACYSLGRMYHAGLGVAPDKNTAQALYDHACNEARPGDAACMAVERQCEADAPRSCYAVAKAFYWQKNARAVVLYERACRADLVDACLWAGILYQGDNCDKSVPADGKKVKQFFGRACDLGSNDGCGRLLTRHESECQGQPGAPMDAARVESCWLAGLGREKSQSSDTGSSLYAAKRNFAVACRADPKHRACADLDRLCAPSARPDVCRQDAGR